MAINYLNSIDLNYNELIHAQIENQASDILAGTGVEGQLYFNTTDDVLKVWSNGSWSSISGDITSVTAGNYLNGGGNLGDITINHDTTSRNNTTSSDSPAYGGSFTAIDTITTNAYGHVTDVNTKTVTLPASDDTTYDLTVPNGTTNIRLAGSDTTNDDVTISATSNETTVTRLSAGELRIGLPDDVTITGELTVSGTGQSSFAGPVTIPQTPSADTDAASKHYVDQAVTGALSYQGGYNAATNTPNLDSNPSPNPIKTGWTYTVTADGLFFTEQVRVGDVLIAETDAPTALADWTTVQNNVDLADLTTVGIGNVNAESTVNLKGIAVSYNAGTAKVGLDIVALGVDPLAETPSDYFIPIYNAADDENKKVASGDLLNAINSATSKAYTISDTATITYPFTLTAATQNDTIIQLVDTVTNETVYADVDRISTSQATVTFASTPTNSIRVLVQKIG